ncbi:MAG TPA: CHASE2 domain-containing protein [Verrucomicrobiae bacterium]|nr:CHASE2 domain-containing protein [Verrucomicrobiae bacterium]
MTVAAGILLVSLTPLADLSYDLSCQAKPDTAITNAVFVYFNQRTLRDLGSDHGNLNRTNHAVLLNRLAQDGAKLVFYDVVFDLSNQVQEVDQTLARAIRKQGAVILVCGFEDSDEQGAGLAKAPSLPTPLFLAAAKGWGHVELFGNVVREISGDYTSIPYAVWVAATNLEPQKLKDEDRNRDRWLNYYGGPDSAAFAHCSLQDALANNIPPGFFAKKIVFVGQNFPSDNVGLRKDTFATPYSRFGAGPMPGVEIHATALLNLLRDDWLRPVPWPWQWLGATIWAIIFTSVLYSLSRKPKIILVLTAALGLVLLCAVSLYIQWHVHWWWSWVGPAFGQTAAAFFLVSRSPKPDPYIAFISYRTEEDGAAALLIARSLSDRGHKTFLDVRSLHAGKFDEQLLREIEAATFFIPILSPNSLARCANEDDWVLKEITHALSHGKRIIPVLKSGFNFDAKEAIPDLPQMAELRNYHGLSYSNSDFEGFMRRLTELLK